MMKTIFWILATSLVSLCVFKTPALADGAVKDLYNCIQGTNKDSVISLVSPTADLSTAVMKSYLVQDGRIYQLSPVIKDGSDAGKSFCVQISRNGQKKTTWVTCPNECHEDPSKNQPCEGDAHAGYAQLSDSNGATITNIVFGLYQRQLGLQMDIAQASTSTKALAIRDQMEKFDENCANVDQYVQSDKATLKEFIAQRNKMKQQLQKQYGVQFKKPAKGGGAIESGGVRPGSAVH